MSTPAMPPFPKTDTDRVAERLHELCSKGQWTQAMQELYADNARHVEAFEMPGGPNKRVTEGKAALLAKDEHFKNTTIQHGSSCGKPMVNGDQFACTMSIDCEHKEGPFAGVRMNMSEIALYTVKNGKIVEGKFFYSMSK